MWIVSELDRLLNLKIVDFYRSDVQRWIVKQFRLIEFLSAENKYLRDKISSIQKEHIAQMNDDIVKLRVVGDALQRNNEYIKEVGYLIRKNKEHNDESR